MNPNESSDVQSLDVESLMKQLPLRRPSGKLDVAVAGILASDESNQFRNRQASGNSTVRASFGWSAILATAAAAMLAGVWLGYFLKPTWELLADSNVAATEEASPDAKLTPVVFNFQAFNLLHGHSVQREFEDCGQCHQQADIEGGAMGRIFEFWFYGDEHFFEAHPGGVSDCSKCHVAATRAGLREIAGYFPPVAPKLANCSDCHKVGADGFDGFEKDWHAATSSSEG